MGQGTESCGGYDVLCDTEDEYGEGLARGMWKQRDGTLISVDSMSTQHLHNTKRMCERLAQAATFSSDANMWQQWVALLENTLDTKCPRSNPATSAPAVKRPQRGKKVALVCACGTKYEARLADLWRGWGQSCSKSCAALKRDFGGRVCMTETGLTVKQYLKTV